MHPRVADMVMRERGLARHGQRQFAEKAFDAEPIFALRFLITARVEVLEACAGIICTIDLRDIHLIHVSGRVA
jgi:hypothetical protein